MKKLLAAILACSMIASVGVSTLVSAAENEQDSKFGPDGSAASGWLLKNSDAKSNESTRKGEILPAETYYVSIEDIFLNLTDDAKAFKAADGTTKLTAAALANGDEFKVSLKKGSDNSKIIKKLSVTTLNKGEVTGRKSSIKIETADVFDGDEYKITPEFTFTGQNALKKSGADWRNTKITSRMTLYVQNQELTGGSNDIEAGTGGYVIKPETNADNDITWTQDGDNMARLTFYADSDVIKVFPKLSTKWDNSDYFEYFNNQDAFIYEFIGNNTVSSTSRALLEIYNPYIDEDGNLTVDLDSIYVYEVKDGELIDVTDNWTKSTNEDGDEVISTKTRVLGTYILAEEEVDIANGGDVIDEPSTGEPGTTPGKTNPPTGR